MSFWPLRKRVPSEPVQSGAIVRIMMGDFGTGAPFAGVAQVLPLQSSAVAMYHQGDVFLPGTQNYVYEPTQELPLNTIWGRGFIRNPNTFNPIQPPQVFTQPNLAPNGIGGLVAGDMELQALINPTGEVGPFAGDWAYDSGLK
jgi:hypothetical protein